MSTEVKPDDAEANKFELFVADPADKSMVRIACDRTEWLYRRRQAVGSSELSVILGLNPWAKPWEVWATKRGLLEDWEGNPATNAGQMLEGPVLDHAERTLGKLKRNVYIRHNDLPLAATCDSVLADCWRPVEAKTTGIVGPIYGTWGEEATDQVPDQYLIQVHAQLMCTGADLGYLFALIPGRGFVEFNIERNERLYEGIGNRVTDWWHRHITLGIEPSTENALPSLDVVKRLRKTPGKVITGDADLQQFAEALEKARKMKSEAEKHAKEVETMIRIVLGDAEAAKLPDGSDLILSTINRRGYTVEPCKYTQLKKVKSEV